VSVSGAQNVAFSKMELFFGLGEEKQHCKFTIELRIMKNHHVEVYVIV
jgi:hypothetical protein